MVRLTQSETLNCARSVEGAVEEWTRITPIEPVERQSVHTERACLVLIYPAGPELGRRFELEGHAAVLIGRGADCDIRLDRNSVSRKHARVTRIGTSWNVQDLGSTNGSYVNDRPVSHAPLRDGDRLKIGSAIFKFLVGGNVESAYHEEIYRMAIIDGLTQAYNKRYFIQNLEREILRAEARRPLSLLIFDIDHFKKINDEHGHLMGDQVLRELAGRVRSRVRREEVFARYGGEEFTLTLPDTDREHALHLAEQLRLLVAGEPFTIEGKRILVTISMGVSSCQGETAVEPFLKLADDNLYRAKRAGRNRVVG
jgi:two-component system cell cycle response regulator